MPGRSFRAEHVSRFVKALLNYEAAAWIRRHARGSERFGLVASSGAMRLKPHAVDVRVEVDPIHYFLGERDDVRSSYYLEDAATEFQVQGLELDWAVVNWDADLRYTSDAWQHHTFHGQRWKKLYNPRAARHGHLHSARQRHRPDAGSGVL